MCDDYTDQYNKQESLNRRIAILLQLYLMDLNQIIKILIVQY